MKEVCVLPFVNHVRSVYKNHGSLQDAWKEIPRFRQRMANLVLDIGPRFVLRHSLAVNTLSLAAIAAYEFARLHGAHTLPGTESVLGPFAGMSISNTGENLGHGTRRRHYRDAHGNRYTITTFGKNDDVGGQVARRDEE